MKMTPELRSQALAEIRECAEIEGMDKQLGSRWMGICSTSLPCSSLSYGGQFLHVTTIYNVGRHLEIPLDVKKGGQHL